MDTQEKDYKEITERSEANKSEHQEEQVSVQERTVQDDEIDLIELVKKLWAERKILYILVPIFFLLGILVALISPEEYTAETTLMPQSGSSGGF